jgi:phosphoesterase RecJ-like protein
LTILSRRIWRTRIVQSRKIELERIATLALKADSIAVFPHTGADGDCLGAGTALKIALEATGKNAVVIADMPLVPRYLFLPHSYDVAVFDGNDSERFMSEIFSRGKADLAILVDCSVAERTGKCSHLFEFCDEKAVIDHHFIDVCAFSNCCIDTNASSTGELIYDFIEILEEKTGLSLFSRDIADNILAAIYFDTGGLRYSNTTVKAFGIAKDLFDRFSPDLRTIVYNIFERTPKSKICIQAKAFSTVRFLLDDRIAISVITSEMINECGADDDDMDGICTSLKNIECVAVAFVLRERSGDEIRVNIRSSEIFDASEFAREMGGGGHKRAAGFSVNKASIEDVFDIVVRKSTEKLLNAIAGGV